MDEKPTFKVFVMSQGGICASGYDSRTDLANLNGCSCDLPEKLRSLYLNYWSRRWNYQCRVVEVDGVPGLLLDRQLICTKDKGAHILEEYKDAVSKMSGAVRVNALRCGSREVHAQVFIPHDVGHEIIPQVLYRTHILGQKGGQNALPYAKFLTGLTKERSLAATPGLINLVVLVESDGRYNGRLEDMPDGAHKVYKDYWDNGYDFAARVVMVDGLPGMLMKQKALGTKEELMRRLYGFRFDIRAMSSWVLVDEDVDASQKEACANVTVFIPHYATPGTFHIVMYYMYLLGRSPGGDEADFGEFLRELGKKRRKRMRAASAANGGKQPEMA